MENMKENYEMIWKIWKKDKLNSDIRQGKYGRKVS